MSLSESTITIVDCYWASYFGCSPEHFSTQRTLVLPHAALRDYQGVFIFLRGQSRVISVPQNHLDTMCAQIESLAHADLSDQGVWRTVMKDEIQMIIGPAFIGYANATTLIALPTSGARLLCAEDRFAFERLKLMCPPMDWEYGGSEFGTAPLAGQFVGKELVAVAGFEVWGESIAHIAVITHPAYRDAGYGKNVVSLIAQTALGSSLVPQYRTLVNNRPSMNIAAALGFEPYALTVAIRLNAEGH